MVLRGILRVHGRVWRTRTEICITTTPLIVAGSKPSPETATPRRSTPWRAGILLLSADGIGTNEIMRHRQVEDLLLAWQKRWKRGRKSFGHARPEICR